MIKRIFYSILFLLVFLFSCKTNNRVTPYEYALLSAHVYNDGTRTLPEEFETLVSYEEDEKSFGDHLGNFLNGLDIDKVVELNKEEKNGELIGYLAIKAVSAGGYYGQAYINKSSNQLIIAHRGTDNLINALSQGDVDGKKASSGVWEMLKDLDDDYDILLGKIPKAQFIEAQAFTKKAKRSYQKQFEQEPEVVHTGHSLGAVLAELCAIEDNCQAITFESPGTAPLLKELATMSHGKFDYQNFDPRKANITTYNARPNRINTLHQHVGKVVPLYKENRKQKAYSDEYLFENITGHAIDSLLTRFDQRSGKPKN